MKLAAANLVSILAALADDVLALSIDILKAAQIRVLKAQLWAKGYLSR